MAIGITRAVDTDRLFNTVSKPISENYLHADNFAGLSSLIEQVLADSCQVPTTTSKLLKKAPFVGPSSSRSMQSSQSVRKELDRTQEVPCSISTGDNFFY